MMAFEFLLVGTGFELADGDLQTRREERKWKKEWERSGPFSDMGILRQLGSHIFWKGMLALMGGKHLCEEACAWDNAFHRI